MSPDRRRSDPPKYDAVVDDERSGVRRATPVPRADSEPPPTLRSLHDAPGSARSRKLSIATSPSFAPKSGAARPRSLTPPPSSSPTSERVDRLEKKLALAKVVLADLPKSDPRARLLEIAVMRRDEVLIDGVLGGLHDAARRESGLPALSVMSAWRDKPRG